MIYPVLDFFKGGGGLLIAVIAVVHVYVAHFAVGGGLFLVLTEMRARRKSSAPLMAYVKRSTRFFLLLTMVFGGLSGVAIWFTIGILSPDATGKLIEIFLFAWAAEWAFFSVEITALLVYWYRFDSLSPRDHLCVGWIYFGSAWLSLFIINGVISFMLTPGAWLETGRFWDAFFNPSFWPSTLFRTFIAIWAAGLFGYVTAAFSKDDDVRGEMLGLYTAWVVGMGVAVLLSGRLYLASVPTFHLASRYEFVSSISQLVTGFTWCTLGIVALALLMPLVKHRFVRKPLAIGVLVAGLLHMGLFEMVREHGRKPWIVTGVIYANNRTPSEAEPLKLEGLRGRSTWLQGENLTGRNLFKAQCLSCHSVDGVINDIRPITARYTPQGLAQSLNGQGVFHSYMPPFYGDTLERELLADYLTRGLHGERAQAPPASEKTVAPAPATQVEPVLLAWRNTSGNGRLKSPVFASALDHRQWIEASLVLKGEYPEVVMEGVDLIVTVSGQSSPMAFDDDSGLWRVDALSGRFDGRVLVRAVQGGETLNEVVLPPEPESSAGCFHCHGGEADPSGLSESTARNILAAHDKNSSTSFVAQANMGQSITCNQCHTGSRPSPSAALHGWHTPYMADKGDRSCLFCHSSGPNQPPAFFSGRHGKSMGCTPCHGSLGEHSASLLKPYAGAEADLLKKPLGPMAVGATPRGAYTQVPDCLSCHEDFGPATLGQSASMTAGPEDRFSAMNDGMDALACAACHGRAHELVPSSRKESNAQGIAYMKSPGVMGSVTCTVCHAEEMEDEGHHDGMLRNR